MVGNIKSMNVESKTFCIMPWIQTNISLPYTYNPCCNSGVPYHNTTVKDFTIQEAFNGVEHSKLRQQLDSEKRPSICNVCWIKEDAGIYSERQGYNEQFKNYFHINKPTLKYLDVEFDNVCNLQCVMCNQHSSDQIWKLVNDFKEKGLPLPTSLKNHKQHNYYSTEKKQYVKDVLTNGVDIFKVTGGEPLLSKDFLEILNFAIEKDLAKDLELNITTNGTKFSKTILEKIKKFKKVKLTISIDGTGEVYEYIRHPFSWKQIDKRLLEISKYDYINIELSCVVQAYNWLNLDQLVNYSKHFVNFDFKIWPPGSELSPDFLPHHILDLGLDRIKKTNCEQIINFENFVNFRKSNRIPKGKLERINDLLYETTINYDTVRDTSYKTLDPTLVAWLKTLKI